MNYWSIRCARMVTILIILGSALGWLTTSVAASADATPVPAETSGTVSQVEAADLTEYADLLLLFSGTEVTPRTYPGMLCVQVFVDPPIYSGSWIGTMCESSTPETTVWHSDEYVTLPVSSAYSLSILSNTTGCTATPVPGIVQEIDGDNMYGRLEVRLDCPPTPPEPEYSYLELRVQDTRGGGGSFSYPGDLCVEINADPPLAGGPLVGSSCDDVSPSGATWFPPDFPSMPVSSIYTASIASNETGCEAEIQHQVRGDVIETITDPAGEYLGLIVVYLDCISPTETPEPSTTPISTLIPGSTEEPVSTEIPSPTTIAESTLDPDPLKIPATSIAEDPISQPTTIVVLPSTGSGTREFGIPLGFLIGGPLLVILGASYRRFWSR